MAAAPRGWRRRALLPAAMVAAGAAAAPPARASSAAMGPLVPAPGRRYFARPDGVALLLAGVHSWMSLQDLGATDPPAPFDYEAYLRYLSASGQNCIRLWSWDSARVWEEGFKHVAPLPYRRTGPGTDALGKPRFDLTRPDTAYFARLRARAEAARRHGLYVAVMLWNSWSLHNYYDTPARSPWPAHPFHRANNINGIDGDPEDTGDGARVQTLADPAVTALQQAYLRTVVEAVGDLDNILYEITNEALFDTETAAWHHSMIGYLEGLQHARGQRHPIGMTAGYKPDVETANAQLLASGAAWISLSGRVPEDRQEPPPAPPGRISLLDTDHVFGVGGDALWVWKAFLRGHNLLYMDTLIGLGIGGLMIEAAEPTQLATQRSGRTGIAGACAAAAIVRDMAGMAPHPRLASSALALADPGRAYIALAETGRLQLDLSHASRPLAASWIAVETGERHAAGVVAGGGIAHFDPPILPAALVVAPPA